MTFHLPKYILANSKWTLDVIKGHRWICLFTVTAVPVTSFTGALQDKESNLQFANVATMFDACAVKFLYVQLIVIVNMCGIKP